MLIATQNQTFLLDELHTPITPEKLGESESVGAIFEAGEYRLVAVDNGVIRVWRKGKELQAYETGIDDRIVSMLVVDFDPAIILLGTEPPHMYRVAGPTGPATRLQAFEHLQCRSDWFTPWGGPPAVRSLARANVAHLYADIHVGSIMRSDDAGNTWEPVTPTLDQDVHQVATTPASPHMVFANTADGVWISPDHGDTWEHRPFPGDATYGRAIAVHPENPKIILATVSNGPHGDDVHGRLFRTEDAGRTWLPPMDGFPESTPNNIDTHCVIFDGRGHAWVAVDTKLFHSDDNGATWSVAWQAPAPVECISVAQKPSPTT